MKEKEPTVIPIIRTRGIVLFPGMCINFDITEDKSLEALRLAVMTDRRVIIVALLEEDDTVAPFTIGTIAEVRQIYSTPNNGARIMLEGIVRAEVVEVTKFDKYDVASVELAEERKARLSNKNREAYVRALRQLFKEYMAFVPRIPDEIVEKINSEERLDKLFEFIAFNIYIKPEYKQQLLELNSLTERIKYLIDYITKEIQVMRLESEINSNVRANLDNAQREIVLREQLREINRQLGNNDSEEEIYEYCDAIQELGFPEDIEDKLLREANKLFKVTPASQEYGLIKSYLDSVLEVPWNTYTEDSTDLTKAEKQLNSDHYGLDKVKERILEIISVRRLNPEIKSQIICLVGPPGVGKTSIGQSIAKALGRRFQRISLGGVRDEAEIRGHRKTYLGSMPGRIVEALKQAKCMNPVILFDEIDKMGNDYKGDPASAMLEVLDPEQNSTFTDHYLEIPTDLSNVLFITTANTLDTIPAPLRDRMEIIELGSYTREEKFNIAKKHLLPKQLKKHGETRKNVKISDKAIYDIIDCYTREAGVRRLEKQLAAICRKSARRLVDGETVIEIKPANLSDFLGVKKYQPEQPPEKNEIGTVTGLAWTAVGGVTMPLEVLVMDGTGKIEITGSLGDVMKESAKIAVSLVRSIGDEYGIEKDFYKNKDLHIHAPEGAVPKDGPSAGVTMTTALVSALSGIAVRRDVAMTGEITLHGKVLPIGGLKEKSMAAYRAGIKNVIFPKENLPDLDEVDEVVKNNVSFIPADNIGIVLSNALAQPKPKRNAKQSRSELPQKTRNTPKRKDSNELQQSRI